jgi:hypothetical protein
MQLLLRAGELYHKISEQASGKLELPLSAGSNSAAKSPKTGMLGWVCLVFGDVLEF